MVSTFEVHVELAGFRAINETFVGRIWLIDEFGGKRRCAATSHGNGRVDSSTLVLNRMLGVHADWPEQSTRPPSDRVPACCGAARFPKALRCEKAVGLHLGVSPEAAFLSAVNSGC